MALTQAQQKTLVETDRGTPMGVLFRRYWIPALLDRELPEPVVRRGQDLNRLAGKRSAAAEPEHGGQVHAIPDEKPGQPGR